ncbi:aminotransferase class I/II-fold pyridoxal phosphate-dependent enzyme [uncultured Pseudokineococcus sp.]|uniref:pyridoxal phosphate-dependent decarboxylase family protein n=1 Tax=uncultured Pseudokineococcus sp. TaxID=1642928 RepID=UPI00260F1922|nr:aminotransferase class I/II-fold pyridoxal phosphate-dependent enzyme [uncultured Pseudokineococcus sp.]
MVGSARRPAPTADAFLRETTADAYVATMSAAVDVLSRSVRGARRPHTGAPQQELQELVDAVDLDAPLGDTPAALEELSRVWLDHAVWFHAPGYVAHLNCPVALPALAADLLASAVNTSMDTYDQSRVATLLERRLLDWAAERAGLGPGARGVFTSGGTQSNTHALLLAREAALAARGLARPDELLPGRLRVLASDQAHFSVTRAARLLGLGADAVVRVPTDARHRLDPAALARVADEVRAAGDVVAAVVATAGTTDLGRVDPLAAVADVCDERGLWLHVDAAYGGGLLVSRRRRHLLDGVERASSVTVDFHKTFFQPVASSAVLVRDGAAMDLVAHHAAYLNPREEGVPNHVDTSLQTTRRFDAVKLWLTLRVMGADALGDAVDACVDLAADVAEDLARQPDVELHSTPELSTVLFRLRPLVAGPDGVPTPVDDGTADALVGGVRDRLAADGAAAVARTVLDGRPWLKMTFLDPATTRADVADVLRLVREAGEDLLAPLPAPVAAAAGSAA